MRMMTPTEDLIERRPPWFRLEEGPRKKEKRGELWPDTMQKRESDMMVRLKTEDMPGEEEFQERARWVSWHTLSFLGSFSFETLRTRTGVCTIEQSKTEETFR